MMTGTLCTVRGAQSPGYNLGGAGVPDARAGYRPALTGLLSDSLLLKQPLTTLMHELLHAAILTLMSYNMHTGHVPDLHVFDIRSLGTT